MSRTRSRSGWPRSSSGHSLFVDIAYAPWVIRVRDMLGLELPAHLEDALARLTERPAFALEVEIVRSL